MFGPFKKKEPPQEPPKKFPPVPAWRPAITQSLDQIIDRLSFYTNGQRDIVALTHGTCVMLPDGLSDNDAERFAFDVLSEIFNHHPDMNPMPMKDGNVLVQYNHPAVNLVLDSVAAEHWAEISSNHQRALATDEVLITPLGSNVFNDVGKKALFGRCFMFMDAQDPRVIRIARKVV
ncbi:hypothetical protein [Rhodanobacter sp. A1T4]|uniref:hypothetical protein n=1 Tax=Rhodanobacter sp. A1T4 TaxID=2723087 RepID=UPI001611CED2|nr:hypothetical protein [Rhodanobacter sp. A1T4]MBB6249204.1 hypothetical protein [Rhodanobacter sp. A1T4]